jgi:uncharacterized protein HemX
MDSYISLSIAIATILALVITIIQFRHQISEERKARSEAFQSRGLADAVKMEALTRRLETCEKDITRAYGKIGSLETTTQQTALSIARMEVEMKNVRESQQRIETLLEGKRRNEEK